MRRFGLALALWASSGLAAFAGDWTNWRGPKADGFSPETGLPANWSPNGQNLAWKARYGCRSTPLVMKGRVFLLNYDAEKIPDPNGGVRDKNDTIQERVLCLDADTGKMIWEHKFPVFHTDIVTVRLGWTNLAADPETGYVYAHGTSGLFFCLDGMAAQPKVVWKKSLTEEYGRITGYGGRVTSPVVFGDLVAIGMLNSSWGDQGKGGCRFVAFDKKTGDIRWWSEPGGQPKDTFYSVPVVARIGDEDQLISGGADGGVYGMKANTGEVVWGYKLGVTAVNCSPVVDGTLVYIGQGEENPNNNLRGRVICVDAAKVKNGQPEVVWEVDGIKARYTSPIIHDGKLYITDEIGKLYCLDGKTGNSVWKYTYGRNSRGSPVLADGKIYVGEVNSKFHILDVTGKKPKSLSEQFFPAVNGVADVEINSSPAVSDGRVIFSTGDETYCIGAKKVQPSETAKTTAVKPGDVKHLQIVPADVTVHPGAKVNFKLYGYDANGNFVKALDGAEWSLPTPPTPPTAKTGPPALTGEIKDGALAVDAKKPSQQGYVEAKLNGMTGKARVRVAPVLPYTQDFSKVPDGAVPGGWVNTQGKFLVATVNGDKVLKKVNDKASPLIARGNAFMGLPDLHDYTLEADVSCTQAGQDLPDFGIVVNRYTLQFAGNVQKLRLVSWDALPRVDETIGFKVQPKTWYRLKLTVERKGDAGVIKGKAWERGQAEPDNWTVTLHDPRPIFEGSPALYGYVTGIPEGGAGTDIFYANVRITPNKK
jgi:outer membrane protein assembly factor BamB